MLPDFSENWCVFGENLRLEVALEFESREHLKLLRALLSFAVSMREEEVLSRFSTSLWKTEKRYFHSDFFGFISTGDTTLFGLVRRRISVFNLRVSCLRCLRSYFASNRRLMTTIDDVLFTSAHVISSKFGGNILLSASNEIGFFEWMTSKAKEP